MNSTKKEWKPEKFPIGSKELEEACKFLSGIVQINTVNPPGNETEAAEYCKGLLEKENFENIEIIEPAPKRGSLICRWKGTDPNAKKLVLLAHLDVVPADATNWEKDPFGGIIDGEYVWGRGTVDCKHLVTAQAMACILLKREGFQPKGDVILAFTADEEVGGGLGLGYLMENHMEKINGDYVISESGGFMSPFGQNPPQYLVEIGAKGVFKTTIRVKGKGAHGATYVKKSDSATYKISEITRKLIDYKYPVVITESFRETIYSLPFPGIFKKLLTSKRLVKPTLKLVKKLTGEDLSGLIIPMITDIVNPTMLKGSEKVNIVPEYAEMAFDCRLLPGHDERTLDKYLKEALGKELYEEIEIVHKEEYREGMVTTMHGPLWEKIERIIQQMHEGAGLVPFMDRGSTDSKYFREKGIAAYGFAPVRIEPDSSLEEMLLREHGKNERIWIPNLSYMMEFFYRLVKES